MHPLLLNHVASELNEALARAVISKIEQSSQRDLLLKALSRQGTLRLLISTHPRFSRMHLTDEHFKNPLTPLRFCSYLRARIQGAIITGVTATPNERIASIGLKKGDSEYSLVIELTGKSGNIMLIDSSGVVLDALRYFDQKGSLRPVVPGIKLSPLPPPRKSMEEPVITKAEGTWNTAVSAYYSRLLEEEGLVAERTRIGRVLADSCKRLERKLKNLEGDRERAKEDLGLFRLGGLLAANLSNIKRGEKNALVMDFSKDPAEEVIIPLDERIGPRENMERCFKKAKKAKVAISMLEERLPRIRHELQYLDALRFQWEEIRGWEDLLGLEEEMMQAGYVKGPKDNRPKAEKKAVAEPLRRFTSTEGFEILCGKSGAGNDLILRKYAAPDDVWLHAKDTSGAHCLIRTAGRRISEKAVEEAASIAAFFSKGRASTNVEVIYAEARNVKRPKGAHPGMVIVKEFKAVSVRPKAVK